MRLVEEQTGVERFHTNLCSVWFLDIGMERFDQGIFPKYPSPVCSLFLCANAAIPARRREGPFPSSIPILSLVLARRGRRFMLAAVGQAAGHARVRGAEQTPARGSVSSRRQISLSLTRPSLSYARSCFLSREGRSKHRRRKACAGAGRAGGGGCVLGPGGGTSWSRAGGGGAGVS